MTTAGDWGETHGKHYNLLLEGKITFDECKLAVSKMKINKSPGLDGICIEFYKKLWPVVGKLLVGVFNDSYAIGTLPDSERIAVTTLIFKKGDEEYTSICPLK